MIEKPTIIQFDETSALRITAREAGDIEATEAAVLAADLKFTQRAIFDRLYSEQTNNTAPHPHKDFDIELNEIVATPDGKVANIYAENLQMLSPGKIPIYEFLPQNSSLTPDSTDPNLLKDELIYSGRPVKDIVKILSGNKYKGLRVKQWKIIDGNGRIIKELDLDYETEYDKVGNTERSSPLKTIRDFRYDTRGRKIMVEEFSSGKHATTYNKTALFYAESKHTPKLKIRVTYVIQSTGNAVLEKLWGEKSAEDGTVVEDYIVFNVDTGQIKSRSTNRLRNKTDKPFTIDNIAFRERLITMYSPKHSTAIEDEQYDMIDTTNLQNITLDFEKMLKLTPPVAGN